MEGRGKKIKGRKEGRKEVSKKEDEGKEHDRRGESSWKRERCRKRGSEMGMMKEEEREGK